MLQIGLWFLIVFIFSWLLGPFTQLIMIINPELHQKMGFMEKKAYLPEFRWFALMHRGTAYADMTFLLSGAVFVMGAFLEKSWCIPFGFFTCAVYLYFSITYIFQTILLTRNGLSPTSRDQLPACFLYGAAFFVFGLYGMFYLSRFQL